MTTREENKLNMYNAVRTVCEANREKWQTVTAFVRTYELIQEKLTALTPETSLKSQRTVGITNEKSVQRETMCTSAAEVAAALYAFADEQNKIALKTDVSHTFAGLMRLRENSLTTVCRKILDKARKHTGELGEYGLQASAIDELAAAITAYENLQSQPRTVQAQTKTARQNANRLMTEIDALLADRLDKIIEGIRKLHPDFYNQYTTVRNIVDRRASRNTAEPAEKATVAK